MWWIILIIIVVLILIYLGSTYNSFVVLRNRVKDQWAQIDVQLKRRFDLIPNLVETVKGYTKHESETLEAVIKARNTYVSATLPEDQMKADGELTQAISKLFALTESYPDLKANADFLNLQRNLNEIENKLSYARTSYNNAVTSFNNAVESVPSNIIAKIFSFEKKDLFQIESEKRENIKVNL